MFREDTELTVDASASFRGHVICEANAAFPHSAEVEFFWLDLNSLLSLQLLIYIGLSLTASLSDVRPKYLS